MIKDVAVVSGYIEVEKPIVIVVRDGDSHTPAAMAEAGRFRDI